MGRPGLALCGILFVFGFDAFGDTQPAAGYTTALPGALPDAGSSVLRVFGALILVTAIFLGGVWLFRNWQRLAIRKGGAPKLNVIEVRSLGQRHALYVVGYDQQRMLLASSPAGVTLVSHLPTAEEGEAAAVIPQASFAEAFQQVFQRKA
jgi:flagellar biogenesis protein FliO